MYQKFKTPLYHGTVSEITKIDVTKGRGNKDFGKGFYMAVSKAQAVGMMHKKYKEAVRRSRNQKSDEYVERLYEIQIDVESIKELDAKCFETADDDTMLCLKAYWDGLYGRVGTEQAKQILLGNLEPENLGIQYYIGKQEIVDKLILHLEEIPWR